MKNKRCDWKSQNKELIKYHDNEWAKIIHNDKILFENLILETMQAGLSWLTILLKREEFRKAFDDFNYNLIVNWNQNKIEELLTNKNIIRNRLKIESVLSNSQNFIKIQKEFGTFDKYIWNFVQYQQIVNKWDEMSQIPSQSELSLKISKDLKKRGFKFLGAVTVYSFLQAIGIINDHINDCFVKYL
ncbi:DNA-3-methyladenine glycosylase I [Spiroplasma endosymbiont of Atherix ibis]|uniref:DNA-3-methyladenine glycosylase I n=1 Tax=Spiroplasma endosymbiont of Atherix ibis TaxID=3066291 RepID=UPI0030D39763